MRILYAGSPAPSAKVLDHLAQIKTIEVVGVITQPDKRRKGVVLKRALPWLILLKNTN